MTVNARVPAEELLERDFLEQRARLLEVAAFLDRLDRAPALPGFRDDFRYRALLDMLRVIGAGEPQRTARILTLLSDPGAGATEDRFPPGTAAGAWRGAP